MTNFFLREIGTSIGILAGSKSLSVKKAITSSWPKYSKISLHVRFFCHKPPPMLDKLTQKIGFIGDGNMAKAIAGSMVNKGVANYSQIYVSCPYRKNLNIWEEWKANVSVDNTDVAEKADVVFIAVKPNMLKEAIDGIKQERRPNIKNKLFVSVLAGVTLATLESTLEPFKGCRVIRVMPNTSMLIGEGCSTYTPGKNVTEEDIQIIATILQKAGMCRRVPEQMIDAITGLIGCSPAFIYQIIEGLSDGAVKMGVFRDIATELAAQTVVGAAKMALVSGQHVGKLKDGVCSAGGATIAGVHAMEKRGVRGAMMDAVEASTKRAEELGRKK